ncbi:unnamed protein product [Lepeophtheirus salmonis]|uniref:(salmon louse) hypothetical protein n=1 Tax=Lepeophtheirus salmonis TaxID=72036 RepID=A0A7R8CPK3_LEPSM|nr:unnamed protein product [Lepeophtheirus salmonis]CAF2852593.1 unnamed protein product [Lepeophtheirus salmonis]
MWRGQIFHGFDNHSFFPFSSIMAWSLVWEHSDIDYVYESLAKCKICRKKVFIWGKNRSKFSTVPLREHPQSKHNFEFLAMIQRENQKVYPKGSSSYFSAFSSQSVAACIESTL